MTANISGSDFMNKTNDILNTSLFGNNTSALTKSTTSNDIHVVKAIMCLAIIPILVTFGIFGNTSTILVFCMKKQKHASSIFIIGLAVADLLFLVLRLIANIYSICHIFFIETIRYVRPNSFFWFILSKIPQRVGSLFIILMVLERSTAVWFPLHVRQIWTGKRSLRIAVVLTMLTLSDMVHIVDSLIFSLNERVSEQGEISTDIEAMTYRKYYSHFAFVMTTANKVIFDMLPMPIVFVLNIIIVIGIKRNSFSKSSNVSLKQRKDKEMRTTRMLLTISVLFVLLCGPFQVLFILRAIQIVGYSEVLLSETLLMLNLTNSVINFIMYGINDKFLRRRYLKIWRCQKITSVD